MNKKRAILIALALYIATFIAGVIFTVLLKDSRNYAAITSIIITVLLTGLAGIWYFQGKKVKRNTIEGIKLGVTFILAAWIINFFIFILQTKGVNIFQAIKDYFTQSSTYFSALLVLATTVFIGARGNGK